MKLNEKILYYRKRNKLSQEELAGRVGVSRQAVSKWELGEATPELDKLAALARAFGVTADELLSEEEPQPQPQPEPEPAGVRPPSAENHWGVLGRLVRRYGWLAGVYVALSGLGTTLVGVIARFAFGKMFAVQLDSFGGLGGGWDIQVDPSFNGDISGLEDALNGALGGGSGPFGGTVTAVTEMGEVFLAIATVIIVLGVLVTLAGIVLAAVLYQQGRKNS